MKLLMNRYEKSERILNLGMVVPFTNTERINFGCPKLWAFGNVENYDENHPSEAITYGVLWHAFLEMLLKQMRDHDRALTTDELLCIVDADLRPLIENGILEIGGEDFLQECLMFGKCEDMFLRIRNGVVGWMLSWKSIMEDYRVLDIEITVAAPVMQRDDNPKWGEKKYFHVPRFDFYVVEEEDHIRPARTGEANIANKMKLPFWKVGKIDVLLECRRTGDLWICDHKTSSSPSSFESNIPFDIQLPSYAYLLEWEINHGELQKYKGKKVAGLFYDIVKSKITSKPKLLKNGQLSLAKNVNIASFMFEETIKEHKLGISKYASHIQYLKNNVDPKLYVHRFVHLTKSDIDRCGAEDFAIACQIAEKRSQLVNINKYTYNHDFNVIAHRYPLCTKYGNCRFSSICVANNHPAVIGINSNSKVKWVAENKTNSFPF